MVLLPLGLTAPAGAAPQPAELELVSGRLDLNGSDEPADLEGPTTFTATVEDTTGAITGGSFAVAPLSFQFDVTEPVAATVYVDAEFFQLEAGSATGSINKTSTTEGHVTVAIDVGVNLHVEVGRPAFRTADCTASPVSLRLSSTEPYSTQTRRVTLQDADFAVPAVPATTQCIDIVADGINDRLAGGGHSLTMEMTGEVPLPRIGVHPTTTDLTVTPATSRQGDAVVLTAAVRPGPDAPADAVRGLVEFRDGATVVGEVAVDGGGVATMTTGALPVGLRSLTAAFRGDEVYAPSMSAPVEHLVAAAPTVTIPDSLAPITIGASPRAVTVTIANPAETGAAIDGGRLGLTIARVGTGNAALSDRVEVELRDGSDWVPLEATPVGSTALTVTVPDLDLPPGESRELRFRLRAPDTGGTPSPTACGAANPTCPGPLTITATLAEADGDRVLATDDSVINLIERTRRPTTVAFGGGRPAPHTARPGYVAIAAAILSPTLSGIPWGGAVEVYFDGVQLPVRNTTLPHGEYLDQLPVTEGSTQTHFRVPLGTDPGEHDITLRYLGDAFRGPAEVTSTMHVHPSVGDHFTCQDVLPPGMNLEWGADIVVEAATPSAAEAGTQIGIEDAVVRISMHRPGLEQAFSFIGNGQTIPVPSEGDSRVGRVSIDLDGRGTATPATAELDNKVRVTPAVTYPVPEDAVDQTLTFGGVSGAIAVDGALGDVVPVALSELTIEYHVSNIPVTATCTAVDEPATFGHIEVAGVELAVDPSPYAIEGGDVTLEADTYPAASPGVVTFRSNGEDLGTAPVTAGTATLVTDELADGEHRITAEFEPSDESPGSTSAAERLLVVPAPGSVIEAFVIAALIDFTGTALSADIDEAVEDIEGGLTKADFLTGLSRTQEYLTHVVDQLYRDTLGRAGDAEGVEHWVGRLRAGASVAAVTANFYGSDEYYRRAGGTDQAWVEDLYQKLLGRPAEPAGRDYWIGQISVRLRGGVALAFFQSDESAAFRVADLYGSFLARRPSAADKAYWSPIVKRRGDLVFAVFLAVSSEYGNRAKARFPVG